MAHIPGQITRYDKIKYPYLKVSSLNTKNEVGNQDTKMNKTVEIKQHMFKQPMDQRRTYLLMKENKNNHTPKLMGCRQSSTKEKIYRCQHFFLFKRKISYQHPTL